MFKSLDSFHCYNSARDSVFLDPQMTPARGSERKIVESNITKSYLLGQLGAYSDHSSLNKVIYKSLSMKEVIVLLGLFTQNKTALYWPSQFSDSVVKRKTLVIFRNNKWGT